MRRLLVFLALLATPAALAAQAWNADSALALVGRAIARRSRAAADSSLHDYKAQAHGFVFFLGQFGEGLSEPPRLIKADQLELEVYWKAPGASKQRIVGWRDRAELPTDINYHRDHLGIVQNNFGPLIRLGEGDEVRDVPHPLSPGAPLLYDYAIDDTLTIGLGGGRTVRVISVRVRPRDFAMPRIVGTLYLDAATADLVRLAFNFTPPAYRGAELEDVSIVLENAQFEGRWWLPYRQEVEIRRRGSWLDLPARGIIRGRWEIDDYRFNLGFVDTWFAGEEITSLPRAELDSFPWAQPLAAALQDVAEPVRQNDLEEVRASVERIAGDRALSGLRRASPGADRLSDLVHVNRVEGVTPGIGFVWRAGGDRVELRGRAGYGLADRRGKGRLAARYGSGRGTVELEGFREVRDVGDVPVIAPLLNSLAAQEFGADDGDYYLADGGRVTWRHGLGTRGEWSVAAGREWISSLPVRATPASGTFRPNAPLGEGGTDLVTLGVRRRSEGFAVRRDVHVELALELGRRDGGTSYARLAGSGHLLVPLGGTRLLLRAQGGAATRDVPPHRAFVLGGRGTLLGDDFRRWGGARAALLHVEWRLPVPFLSLKLGPWARTPAAAVLAPFVATGWTGRPVPGTPWLATPDARVTYGAGLEWLGVFRLDVGVGAQTGRVRFAFDVTRDFWGLL